MATLEGLQDHATCKLKELLNCGCFDKTLRQTRLEFGKTEARVLYLRTLSDPNDRANLELEKLGRRPKLCLVLELKLGARKLA
jgi:hypothetical protein